MRVAVICPFDLDRLTGTPIRTHSTVRATATCRDVAVIAPTGSIGDIRIARVGHVPLVKFSWLAFSVLRKEKPDTMHGITTVAILPMLLYKCLHPSARIIFEMHGWAWYEQSRSWNMPRRVALAALDYIGLWSAHTVIVMSETQRAFLKRRTLRPHRIVVIWGPSEFDAEFSAPPSTGGIVVGYIGNAAWWQGLHTLIGAAERLQETPGISFALAGFDAGDERKFPRLPRVSYVGRVERKDVLHFLRSCDVLVSCRLNEGVSNLQYPQKLSEYLSAGRTVIVSAANDQPLIVEKAQCGIVVNPMTDENLAKAIQAFSQMPREARTKWEKRALNFAKDHLVFDVFARKIRTLYEQQ